MAASTDVVAINRDQNRYFDPKVLQQPAKPNGFIGIDRVMIERREKEDIQIENHKYLWIRNNYDRRRRERRYINLSLQGYIHNH